MGYMKDLMKIFAIGGGGMGVGEWGWGGGSTVGRLGLWNEREGWPAWET